MKTLTIAKIAAKNLGRHRRRTLFTAGAVAFGILMYIFVDSLLLGSEQQTEYNLKWYETSLLRIMNAEYWDVADELPLDYLIENPQAIIEDLPQDWKIAPRVVFSAEAVVYEDPYESDGSMQVVTYAIDPAFDTEVFRTFSEDPFANGTAVLGKWLAEDLGADIGYPLTLVTKTRDGYYQTMDLDVGNIIYAPNPIINRSLFMPLSLADEMLDMNGAVTELDINLPESRMLESQQLIQERLAQENITVLNWKELAADFFTLAQTKQSSTSVMILLLFVIAATGVTNTMLMSVQERKREIGMLRSMGMSTGELYKLFIFESLGISIVGSILAVLAAIPLIAWLVNYGIDYSFILRDFDVGYRVSDIFYGAWNPPTFVLSCVAASIISVITSLLPVRKALKQNIVGCLRG